MAISWNTYYTYHQQRGLRMLAAAGDYAGTMPRAAPLTIIAPPLSPLGQGTPLLEVPPHYYRLLTGRCTSHASPGGARS